MSVTFFSDLFAWGWFTQGTLCLALGLTASLLLRRHAARAHQVLRLGMLAALLVPVLSMAVQRRNLGILPPVPEPSPAVSVQGSDGGVIAPLLLAGSVLEGPLMTPPLESAPGTPQGLSGLDPAGVTPPTSRPFPWKKLTVTIWLLVGLMLLFRLARTVGQGIHLLRGASPCEKSSLQRAVQRARSQLSIPIKVILKESEVVRSPVIWCWGSRPVILMQRDIERGPGTDWVSVFCHELAHWKRKDHLTGLWSELWCCVLWWHPLVWWVRQRMETLSEEACDDWVLASGQSGPDYAESLLGLRTETRMALLPTVVGKDKPMKERILRIIKQQSGNPRVGISWALVVILLTSFLIVGSAFAQRRAPRPGPERHEDWEGGALMDQRRELAERQRQVAEEMRDIHEELEGAVRKLHMQEEKGKGGSEDARALRREIQNQERRLHEMQREIQLLAHPGQARGVARPQDEVAEQREKIMHRMEEGRVELEERVDALRELEAAGRGDSDRAGQLRRRIGQLERFLPELERELHAFMRQHEERIMVEQRQARLHELEIHQQELRQQQRRLQEELAYLGDEHPKRGDMRNALEEIQHQLERIEQARHEIHSPELVVQPRPEQRHRRYGELEERAEGIHRALQALGDTHPDLSERLERELHELRAQMEEIERADQREDRERSRPDLEIKVRELNGKVERLGHEMREIRGLLERLVEQKRGRSFEVEEEEVERRVPRRERRPVRDRDEAEEGPHRNREGDEGDRDDAHEHDEDGRAHEEFDY